MNTLLILITIAAAGFIAYIMLKENFDDGSEDSTTESDTPVEGVEDKDR